MEQDFDPYLKWLGVRSEERPPNHYALLGIGLFEDDPEAIANAADRQMAHVRTYQAGKHSALSQRLLNELATARICLLNPARKTAYDSTLQGAEREQAETADIPVPPPPPETPEQSTGSPFDYQAESAWLPPTEQPPAAANPTVVPDAAAGPSSRVQPPVSVGEPAAFSSATVALKRRRRRQSSSPLLFFLLFLFVAGLVVIIGLTMQADSSTGQPASSDGIRRPTAPTGSSPGAPRP